MSERTWNQFFLFIKHFSLPEARFFSLQAVENTLKNRYKPNENEEIILSLELITSFCDQFRFESLDSAAVEYIQQTMMEYLRREFVDNTTAGSEEACKGYDWKRERDKVTNALFIIHSH